MNILYKNPKSKKVEKLPTPGCVQWIGRRRSVQPVVVVNATTDSLGFFERLLDGYNGTILLRYGDRLLPGFSRVHLLSFEEWKPLFKKQFPVLYKKYLTNDQVTFREFCQQLSLIEQEHLAYIPYTEEELANAYANKDQFNDSSE